MGPRPSPWPGLSSMSGSSPWPRCEPGRGPHRSRGSQRSRGPHRSRALVGEIDSGGRGFAGTLATQASSRGRIRVRTTCIARVRCRVRGRSCEGPPGQERSASRFRSGIRASREVATMLDILLAFEARVQVVLLSEVLPWLCTCLVSAPFRLASRGTHRWRVSGPGPRVEGAGRRPDVAQSSSFTPVPSCDSGMGHPREHR